MIRITVAIEVLPDHLAAFTALATSHRRLSLAEPGCVYFGVDLHGERHFTLSERWENQAALDAHRQTPHYLRWRAAVASMEAKPREHREHVETTVFTNGCFDVLHAGHIHLLAEARAQGDQLIVGLNSDASVQRLKGCGRPIMPFADRRQILRSMRCVDEVLGFDTDAELLDMVRRLRPDVLVKGTDAMDRPVPGAEYAGRLHFVDRVGGASTTDTIRRVVARVN